MYARDLMHPAAIEAKIGLFSPDEWEYLSEYKKHIWLEIDRIILPWFPKGIKWRSEIGQFGSKTAIEKFSGKLMKDHQVQELLEHLSIFENQFSGIREKVLRGLLQLDSEKNTPYLVEGNRNLSNLFWFKWLQAHELFFHDGKITYQQEGKDRPTIHKEIANKAYKVRLLAA